jgi:hypothetical protein
MESTRNRKNTTSKKSKKVEEQDVKTNKQETVQPTANDVVDTSENKIITNDTSTPEDEKIYRESPTGTSKTKSPVNPFASKMASKIMARIYEMYGYKIEGDACKALISQAEKYANAHNISINTDVETINTYELYDYIVTLISNGYNVSPLDDTYRDIFLRAVVERHKV